MQDPLTELLQTGKILIRGYVRTQDPLFTEMRLYGVVKLFGGEPRLATCTFARDRQDSLPLGVSYVGTSDNWSETWTSSTLVDNWPETWYSGDQVIFVRSTSGKYVPSGSIEVMPHLLRCLEVLRTPGGTVDQAEIRAQLADKLEAVYRILFGYWRQVTTMH